MECWPEFPGKCVLGTTGILLLAENGGGSVVDYNRDRYIASVARADLPAFGDFEFGLPVVDLVWRSYSAQP